MATDENHERNAYFAELDAIAAKLDETAKILTPDESDDGTPPDAGERTESNSYFASFANIASALERLKEAIAERIEAGGGIDEESDPVFKKWRDESYSLGLGKGANVTSNGVAIGWNSSAGSGTGTGSNDSGAVAVGKAAQAWGIGAAALGKGAVAGSTSARTTLPTVQLGAGQNANDGTLQFRDWQIVDASGTIPAERLSLSSLEFRTTTITRGASGFCNINDHAVNSITPFSGLRCSPPRPGAFPRLQSCSRATMRTCSARLRSVRRQPCRFSSFRTDVSSCPERTRRPWRSRRYPSNSRKGKYR